MTVEVVPATLSVWVVDAVTTDCPCKTRYVFWDEKVPVCTTISPPSCTPSMSTSFQTVVADVPDDPPVVPVRRPSRS